jgi:hypothetical protein
MKNAEIGLVNGMLFQEEGVVVINLESQKNRKID